MVALLADASLVFLMSAIACIGVGRVAVRYLSRAQCIAPVRYEDCPPLLAYHVTKPPTPTMGGLVVLGVGILSAALAGGLGQAGGWLILLAVIALGLLGLMDDMLKFRRSNAGGVPGLPKLLVALGVGAMIGIGSLLVSPSASLVEVPWLQRSIDLGWAWIPFAMLVMAGCAHAVNLTDGMDGLASGCMALALAVFGWWALSDMELGLTIAPWSAALAGACIGFLWFNSFPAAIVLGDVGALGLGAALGAISLLTHTALWLLIVGGVFVVEALSVMAQVASYKWRNKRRIFRVAPLHHHFHLGGLPEPKVVIRFWIAGLFLALVSLSRTVTP